MAPDDTQDAQHHALATLARSRLVLAAVAGGEVVADQAFAPGQSVYVGSNSGNALVLPERYELTSYKLIEGGAKLCVVPPLYIQATVWLDGVATALRGHVRTLRKEHPGLPDELELASQTFLVRYASGIAFMGRYLLESTKPG